MLPKNVDKDPAWRARAVFDRPELVSLISDERAPEVRRVLNALKGLAALRHGEAAGVRWFDYDPSCAPLGKLLVTRSYDQERTKTQISREVPVHPALAAMLAGLRSNGWRVAFGRDPELHDLIVPGRSGDVWEAHDADDFFKDDLAALGLRHRRGHDLRRTFITLAQVDGARSDILKVITHGPAADDIVSLYTSFPWPTLCAEVAKLAVEAPSNPAAIEVVEIEEVATKDVSIPAERCSSEDCYTSCYASTEFPSALEPLARFERATYGLRRHDGFGIDVDPRESSFEPSVTVPNLHASSRILVNDATTAVDHIALYLSEAQSSWLRLRDRRLLRRALLGVLSDLEREPCGE